MCVCSLSFLELLVSGKTDYVGRKAIAANIVLWVVVDQ